MKRLLFVATPEQHTKLNELMSINTLHKKRVFSFVQIFTDPIRDRHDHTRIIRRNSLIAKGTHIGCNTLINQRVPRNPDSLQTKLVFSDTYSDVIHVDYLLSPLGKTRFFWVLFTQSVTVSGGANGINSDWTEVM